MPQVASDGRAPDDIETSSAGDTVTSEAATELGVAVPVRRTVPCTVERLIDGDTIECRGAGRVRLIGMDTPEVSTTRNRGVERTVDPRY